MILLPLPIPQTPPRLTTQDKIWGAILILSQLATFASGSYLWCARIGWVVLVVLFVLDTKYAIFSIFFFSAFFHSSHFFVHLPLTVKHFHLAVFLILMIQTLRGELWKELKVAFRNGRLFFPFLFIPFLGGVNLFFYPSFKALYTLLNLSLVWGLMFYAFGMTKHAIESRGTQTFLLQRAISFFVWGVIVQTFLGFYNTMTQQLFMEINLFHNNHLGFLCAITLFYAFHRSDVKNPWWKTLLITGATLITFAGLFASLSRTAWFSFVFSFFIYLFVVHTRKQTCADRNIHRAFFRYVLILFVLLGMMLCMSNHPVMERVYNLPQLLDLHYWQYTIHDKGNFGFLGALRLRDLTTIREILSQTPIFGIGFLRKVVDMHGFFWVILGATGLMGFTFFSLFIIQVLKKLWEFIWGENRLESIYLACAVFSSIIVWLTASLLETYFLQFFIWLPILIASFITTQAKGQTTENRTE